MVAILIILFVLAKSWSESSSATIFCVYEQRRLWSDFADALARLSPRCLLDFLKSKLKGIKLFQ